MFTFPLIDLRPNGPRGTFPLLELPLEVRQKIYDCYVSEVSVAVKARCEKTSSLAIVENMVNTCRQMREEITEFVGSIRLDAYFD